MRWRFGSFELIPATRELISGGVPRPVEPQVFDLLCYLIEHRSHVVSQDDLISAIWNGRIVSDAAIAARISAARSAVGDDGKSQRWIRTIPRKGFRFVGAVDADEEDDHHPATTGGASSHFAGSRSSDHQRIGFCRSADDTRIAYALSGEGYTLVKAGHWLTHVERDWNSPIWRPLLDALDASFRVLRYDQRGNGLSDWELKELSLEVFVQDLEAVVDAAGLQRFALYGTSQGAPIAVAYASRHPDRVSHLVLHGGFERGRLIRASAEEREQAEAILTLMRHGWGKSGGAFIEAFATLFIPDGDRRKRRRPSAGRRPARRQPPPGANISAYAGPSCPRRQRSAARSGATAGSRHPWSGICSAREPEPRHPASGTGMVSLPSAFAPFPECMNDGLEPPLRSLYDRAASHSHPAPFGADSPPSPRGCLARVKPQTRARFCSREGTGRRRIEAAFYRLKDFRRITTRCDNSARHRYRAAV